ncbi:MAG TPA: (2Fe-2S)-binding protein [Rhodocyclaceae bacterium]|nr:(2Fe-2S)-binding protein [Rhodocyclaceae bacterium]
MYVCVCKALTEKDVHSAVAEGCSSVKELKRRLGLGSECGRCAACAKGMIQQANGHGCSNHDRHGAGTSL